jgi:hypothetical protein
MNSSDPTIRVSPGSLQRADLVLSLLLTLAHLVYVLLVQGQVTVYNGIGWDGGPYLLMATRGFDTVGWPWGERIAVPFLARHSPFADVILNFEIDNLVFGIGFSLFAYLAVARVSPYLSRLSKITAWCMLSATQLSPIAQSAWYPIQTDAASNCLMMVLIYAVLSRVRSVLFYFVLFFCGTLVREIPCSR